MNKCTNQQETGWYVHRSCWVVSMWLRVALVCGSLNACSDETATPTPVPASETAPNWAMPPPPLHPTPRENPRVLGIRWDVPPAFEWRQTTDALRSGEYTALDARVLVIVSYAEGSVPGGIERAARSWSWQMRPPEAPAEFATRTVNGLAVATVDVAGRFDADGSDWGSGFDPMDGQRLLGAAVHGPRGPVYFKLVGPKDAVAELVDDFELWVDSLAPVEEEN